MNMNNSVALVATGMMLVTTVAAQDSSLSLSVGVTHSDNIGRVSQNKQSETMPEAGLHVRVERKGRLDANLSTDLLYRGYSNNSFNDELLGGLDARLGYAFIEDRFSWTIEDNFGQSLIDPQAVETPGNRQNFNYLSTGPNITLPLGGRTSLAISGRWSDVSYGESDLENQRLSGTIGLVRGLGKTSSISANVAAQRVEYDKSPPNSDYDLQSAYLAYEAEGVRTRLRLRSGYTALHDFGDTTNGPLLHLALSRETSARSTLSVDAGTELNDSADTFRRDRDIGGVSLVTEDAIASRDPFQQDYATVAWTFSGEHTTLRLSADWRREDHESVFALDRERIGAGISLLRRVGPRLTATLYGNHNTEDFDVTGVDFDEWSAGAGFDWRFSESYSVSVRAERYDGSGDTSVGSGLRNYEETRYSLRFSYSHGR